MKNKNNTKEKKGFSLVEVIVGMMLVGVAMLGLAQLFTYAILTNARADRISNATFLAQQQIEVMRSLTSGELNAIPSPYDEPIDTNNDGTYDFRRITILRHTGFYWDIKVLVFSGDQSSSSTGELVENPEQNKVMANISTVIGR
jgi:prepilin-type N-terminal cleavage/methylation domain-containing protein